MAGGREPAPGTDVLSLVRRFEPVLRFTSGEMFFPMTVDDYLAGAALYRSEPGNRSPTLLVDHGGLDSRRLAEAAVEHPDSPLFLRYAPKTLPRKELRAWRHRPDRPAFNAVSRLAAVGLIGRVIDSGMRLSLVLRGKVPGGLTAAAQLRYGAVVPPRYAYHAHVSRDGGYVVIQYWYLYAMNDWRSSFSGVNDHESDWEQVTVYLVPEGPDFKLAWLAFSSHDEVGDDLRRRHDDPDITWVDGTHPVVNTGAGSHSGAYLPGDYLVRIEPPALRQVTRVVTRVRSLLFPWTRHDPSLGLGIPYVDYRRGDGVCIGAGTERQWTPILIDSQTPWVRDYRGLWGLDTADPFGGERAPAGPRYERNGSIRASWADPVGWAGLDKVPPLAADRAQARAARIVELEAEIGELSARIAGAQQQSRETAAGTSALQARAGEPLARLETELAAMRLRRRDAVNERDRLQRQHPQDPPPHAHLRHRAVPDAATPAGALLRFWAGASLSILLIILGAALLLNLGGALDVVVMAVVVVTAVEALLRGRFLTFLLGLVIISGVIALVWLFFTHLRLAFGVLAVVAAVAIGVANLRNLARR